MIKKILDEKIFNLLFFLSLLLPVFLVTGPFLPDLIISLNSLYFIYFIFSKKIQINFSNIYIRLFIFWIVVILLSSTLSSDPFHSYESSLFYIRFFLSACMISIFIIKNKKFINYSFYILLILLIILSSDAIFQYIFEYNIIGIPKYNDLRVSSFFAEELKLGSYLVRLFPYLIAMYLFINKYKEIKPNLKIIVIFILISISIFLAGERAAIAYLFIILFVTFLSFNYKKVMLFSSAVFLGLYLLISLLDSSSIQRNFSYTYNQIKASDEKIMIFSTQHETIYKSAFEMFKHNIFFGVGPKNFRKLCSEDKYNFKTDFDKSFKGCQTHPHNFYLQLLAETGILSFIIFSIYYFKSLISLFKLVYNSVLKKINNNNLILLYLYLGFFINFFPLVPTGNLFNNWLCVVMFLPLGLYIYLFNKSVFLNNVR